IEHYSTDKIEEPRIQLFAHNKQTYKKVRKLMATAYSIAVVQATGTGKSFLISKLLQDFTGTKRLVMAPSFYVIEQIKEHIRWEADKIEFMTYARSMYLSQSEIAAMRPEMIVLDEYHRCGAEEWGQGVENIMNAYPNAFKFGTTATPVRYLDNGRDMSVELFNGNVAENLNLAQAIVRNILPMPKYVCALYTVAEEVGNMKQKIENSRISLSRKKMLLLEMDAFRIDWERSRGISQVVKKHLKKSMRKFIVFCKDEVHLLEMEPLVKKWFKEIDDSAPVKTYRVYDKDADSNENLEGFKSDTSKEYFQLLFSINMLNEGLHVNDVHGVILLRPTESPNIFYQQIGRCLKVGLNHQPVIFDFVNNFKSIRTKDFLFDLDFERIHFLNQRRDQGLEDRCPKFTVVDEVREITELFGAIKFQLDTWEDRFKDLKEYYASYKTWNFKENDKAHKSLAIWCSKQREKYHKGRLSEDRINKFKQINFPFEFEGTWNLMYDKLAEFKKQFGHCNVSRTNKEYKDLSSWLYLQRTKCLKKTLTVEQQEKLTLLGVEWKFDKMHGNMNDLWETRYNALCAYREKYGSTNVSRASKEYGKLGAWVNLQRQRKKDETLETYRVDKLNSIGFEWDRRKFQEGIWQQRFEELIAFKNKHGHFNVTPKQNSILSKWIKTTRTAYKTQTIDPARKDKLDAMGFEWRVLDDSETVFEKRYAEMVAYKNKNGHLNANKKSPLGGYLQRMRYNFKNNKLPQYQVQKLNEIGFSFEIKESALVKRERHLKALESYYKTHGHCNVAIEHKEYSALYSWLSIQRNHFRQGTLPKNMIEKLELMGIDWKLNQKYLHDWDDTYQKVFDYFKKNGSLIIPKKDKIHERLSGWLANQRQQFNKGRLNEEQIGKLKLMNYNFELHTKNKWEERFNELVEFKRINGHMHVPATDILLFRWCIHVRVAFKKERLSDERIKRFEEIGFRFDPHDDMWQRSYEELKEFLKTETSENLSLKKPKLVSFININRINYKNGILSETRIMLLNMLGITWN
ncbi:MAG: Helicase associated domain protein, partial [Bacteroidota bacterium]